jgi:sugar/nucleoside kinase (ribokinase family)
LSAYDLVIFGDLNGDIMLQDSDPTPVFGQIERFMEDGCLELGGGSAITACQAARLGLKTAFIGKVGDDLLGRLLIDILKRHGVDTQGVIVDGSVKTGFTVHLCGEDDRAMLTYAGSIAALRSEEAPLDLISQGKHFHVSDFFLQPALQEGLADLFGEVKRLGMSTSMDPAWDPTLRWNGGLHRVLPHLDIFLPNDQELCHIAGEEDTAEALRILSQEIDVVVAKVGSQGAVATTEGAVYWEPAHPVKAVDSTGAGDNFNAGFLYGHLRGLPIQDCLRIACICGALSTLGLGGVQAQIDLASLEDLLNGA